MKIQGDGVPQAWDQHTELSFMKVYPSDLMAVGKNYKGLERISAFAAFHVRLQFPALIAGALDSGLLLLTLLATL